MAEALARITQLQDLGMVQIRADLAALGDVIATATGVAIPAQTSVSTTGDRALLWMSYDELLLVLPKAEAAGVTDALTKGFGTAHSLAVDVSDMRAAFGIDGAQALQVLQKLCPADLAAMPADGVRRTRAAQVACGIWRRDGGYVLIGFRSVGDYLRELLQNAARPGTQLDPR